MSPSLRPVPAVSPLSALQGALSGLASLAAGAPPVLRVLSGAHARLLRCWDGRVPDQWFGARLLVLETIGRRSGRLRSTPLVFVRSGEDLVVAATGGGCGSSPGRVTAPSETACGGPWPAAPRLRPISVGRPAPCRSWS